MDKQITIMVVDDEEDFCFFIQRNLERLGYHVVALSDPKKAFSCACDHSPDLILLDIMMPGEDGFEVLRGLKSDERTLSIPVVVLTGVDDDDARVKASALKNEDYIVKPVLVDELRQTLERILTNRGLIDPHA